ncbi:MAG: hypothetical protein IPL35_12705 [Sphingobacteriales bacterium]|nr:hypothetical protein [Sphingobacteriales bacterium]
MLLLLLAALAAAYYQQDYVALPFLMLAAAGYALALCLAWNERRVKKEASPGNSAKPPFIEKKTTILFLSPNATIPQHCFLRQGYRQQYQRQVLQSAQQLLPKY